MIEQNENDKIKTYEAYPAKILAMKDLTEDTRYFKVRYLDESILEENYRPGQFIIMSIPGVGEAVFSISSPPTRTDFLEFGIRKVGSFTNALFKLKVGGQVNIRGPYGDGFDMKGLRGRDLIIVSGGLGAVPLRSVLLYVEDRREEYDQVFFLNGARSPKDMLFREDFIAMTQRGIIETHLSVDKDDTGEWPYNVGVVTKLFPKIIDRVVSDKTTALICGPPIMYKFVIQELLKLKIPKDQILMTLERRMKCGQGHCGHCAVEGRYTCLEGPVFTYYDVQRIKELI
ncbi:MAG: FAD/NAD(P)-binding protein [Candidatus Heimdallarchaeota archaeon]|nr:FAD/NAD(P)-binding protein [Candidatus Heimdallarchaeota archaeon]MCK4878011.1 FAD/NAD(P)-binding protein [Candidatus Heimdallarchaeota archaeon]